MKFDYTIYEAADGLYGTINDNEEWNGMIGEILSGVRICSIPSPKFALQNAQMAVAPLTVTNQRAEVVDFTQPFLSLGISILFRIPDDHTPNLFR